MAKSFYITTTLPYVNAAPHMGHALEFIRADVIARWKKLNGYNVFFNTGTDEHGQKVFTSAKAAGQSVEEYTSEYAEKFKVLMPLLGVEYTNFIRTTDKHHITAAQEFWRRVDKNGFIYKKNYKANYCVGCESEKTQSELENGHCIIHPNLELQIIDEENYFFKFSEFQGRLLEYFDTNPSFVIPEFRMNEMREFIKNGLQDFSISRLKDKMEWGIPVPGDEGHVMYVWFDALTNYISTLGWPEDADNFEKFWINGTPTQYCGKDNTRFQSLMWQAMLMAADLPQSHTIVVNGFVTGDGGVKMSKSIGNVVDPLEIVEKYSTDTLRYFVLREVSTFEDTPVTLERIGESYNASLANGLGNLVSRVMKLAETYLESPVDIIEDTHETLSKYLDKFEIHKAINHIWEEIGVLDKEIQDTKPWETKDKEAIATLVKRIGHIGYSLQAFMPETAEKILKAIQKNKLETSLFPRQ
jgi:methionyl-tRNA synthetase